MLTRPTQKQQHAVVGTADGKYHVAVLCFFAENEIPTLVISGGWGVFDSGWDAEKAIVKHYEWRASYEEKNRKCDWCGKPLTECLALSL